MHHNKNEEIPEELEKQRVLLEELVRRLDTIEATLAEERFRNRFAIIDAKTNEMHKLNQQADEVKAQKEILQKELEESEYKAELYENQLNAMHAAMLDHKEQQEIVCKKMEEIAKNFKALQAEFDRC